MITKKMCEGLAFKKITIIIYVLNFIAFWGEP